jgi:hypothetical protein
VNRLVLDFLDKDLVPTYRPLKRPPSSAIASIMRMDDRDEFRRRRI